MDCYLLARLARETERLKGVLRMNEPITTLDTRHSGPDGVVTPWEETRRVLETAELFWLSTVRADGRPHVTPLVAVWHDGAIHFTAEETAQKTVNLRGNPHVILTTGCNQLDSFHKQEGLTVVVEGDAVRITDQDTLERIAAVWATKWEGSWPYQVRNGYFYLYDEDEQRVLTDAGLVFSVKPTKVFAVAIGRSQTRHQF
jgi:nitroimidazol reductase NimA-like FMN-containing flavoprotein (pyridoxamine 5'-phosphate oxidase superfamily)